MTREESELFLSQGSRGLWASMAVLGHGVITADGQDRVTSMNSVAEVLTGWGLMEAVGKPLHEVLVLKDSCRVVSREGSMRRVDIQTAPALNDDGLTIGQTIVIRPLSEARDHESELARSEEKFRLLVESTHDYAIFMLDPEGFIVSWNLGAERIKGYKAHEIVGHHFSKFYRSDSVDAGWPKEELRRAAADGRFEDEGWRVRQDGTEFWANVIITALRDKEGNLWGFSKITRDLTERRKLERAQLEAELQSDSNRRKDEFIAMLSHELRNPLATMLNAVHLLQLSPDRGQPLETLERQVLHMTRMVEDLLDVSRINTGRIQIKPEVIDLFVIARNTVESLRGTAEDKQIRLVLDLPLNPVHVFGDSTRLDQVLSNLLVNAIKYSNSGTEVRTTITTETGQAVVTIKDQGIGIAPEMLPHVFELFTQAEKSLDRAQGGLGIGLTVVQSVVNLLGGTVEAKSEGRERGSEFIVKLPLTEGLDQGVKPEIASSSGSKRRVLIVDDNRDAADMLALVLGTHGHAVQVAYDGKSALDQVVAFEPETVLLDLGLPVMDGYEVARRIRSNRAYDGVRLVAVSGYGQPMDRERTRNIGFDEHLVKPVEPKQVLENI